MANYSIPSWTPAIGRTSTPLSRRSKRQDNASAYFSLTGSLAYAIGPWPLKFFNAQRSTRNTQQPIQTARWMLGVERCAFSLRRVKGAWWSSRSSKPLSVPHTRGRGRFDSYPLRLFHRSGDCASSIQAGDTPASTIPRKEVTKHVA